jgi:hypothetical protein
MGRPYFWLAVLSGLGLLGAAVALVRRWKSLNKSLLAVLFLLLLFAWGMNFFRGVPYVVYDRLYLSVARHAFPVIIPTMLLFVVGWIEIINLLVLLAQKLLGRLKVDEKTQLRITKAFAMIAYASLVMIWVGLTAGALISIFAYYKII